jgi:hypothetical protein
MVLGDSFPDKKKREYVDRSLVTGAIVRLHCRFTNPPKHKFLLLLSVASVPVFFVINSQPNRFVLHNFPDLQIQINRRDYSFLSHDSTIDCSTPRSDFTAKELRAEALADLGMIKGRLTDRDRLVVRSAIQRNRTIEARLKRTLLNELGAKSP